jgi:small subunit ribosomal protein S20
MPNTKSAIKRLRQDQERRLHKRSVRSYVRNRCRNVDKAIAEKNVEEAEKCFHQAVKALDKAAARKIVHPNMAARKKSRLSAAVRKLKSAGSAS